MKNSRFSILAGLTLLTLGACAAGCGSGSAVDGYVSSDEISDTISDSAPDTVDIQPMAREEEGMTPRSGTIAEPNIIEGPIEKPVATDDSGSGLNTEIPNAVDGVLPEEDTASQPPAVTSADMPDGTLTPPHHSASAITPSDNGVLTKVQPPQEYEANYELHATMEPHQEPEEYESAPYYSATATYAQPSHPRQPARFKCLLSNCR